MERVRQIALMRAARAIEPDARRPLIVGELNPYGPDERFALWPLPQGASGDRLCRLVLGLTPEEYVRIFDRVNLCRGEWSLAAARSAAISIIAERRLSPMILLGSRVCQAFGVPYYPCTRGSRVGTRFAFQLDEGRPFAILPHPSGRNPAWNASDTAERARAVVSAVVETFPLVTR